MSNISLKVGVGPYNSELIPSLLVMRPMSFKQYWMAEHEALIYDSTIVNIECFCHTPIPFSKSVFYVVQRFPNRPQYQEIMFWKQNSLCYGFRLAFLPIPVTGGLLASFGVMPIML